MGANTNFAASPLRIKQQSSARNWGLSPISYYLLLVLLFVSGAAAQAPEQQRVAGLSAERYLARVTYLASDALRGRASGSPELETAADYIAAQFRDAGLQPGVPNGSYFQPFELTSGVELGKGNTLSIDGVSLKRDEDFVPIAFSSAETTIPDAPVVFAGYGITAPEYHWDDYAGVDVKGKVVVVFRHEPQELDANSPFDGKNFTRHASFMNKAINARQHGARGIVFITDPANHAGTADAVGEATRGADGDSAGLAAMHVRQSPILQAFQKAGKDLAAIQQAMDRDLKPQSFEAATVHIKMTTDVVRIKKTVRNVMAALPGSDPALRNEWLVIGGHYDHLGLGERFSMSPSLAGQIHHGADDNASGTSGVMEFAAVAARNPQAFKRSLLFVTFAGEEMGLLGSAAFVENPPVPLDRIAVMFNFDMIGRMEGSRLFMGGVGTAAPFKEWLEEANRSVGLSLDYSESGDASSDHATFTGKRIPVLFFFTGIHGDYHNPSDTADKINANGAIRTLTLAYSMALHVANEPQRQAFVEVQEPRRGSGGGGYRINFGSVPSFRDDIKGVLFTDVHAGSPAGKAGLKAGDILIEFDGKTIEGIYDFTYALDSKQAGDVVAVAVRRGAETIRVNVTLENRQ